MKKQENNTKKLTKRQIIAFVRKHLIALKDMCKANDIDLSISCHRDYISFLGGDFCHLYGEYGESGEKKFEIDYSEFFYNVYFAKYVLSGGREEIVPLNTRDKDTAYFKAKQLEKYGAKLIEIYTNDEYNTLRAQKEDL